MGHPQIERPNLGALAETARLFAHHYVQVPTCGRYPTEPAHLSNHAIPSTRADWGSQSLPAWFDHHGYRTLARSDRSRGIAHPC